MAGTVTDHTAAAPATSPGRVTAALSSIPRMTIDVGPRRLPAFRSIGVVGVQVALLAALLAGMVNGVPLTIVVGLSAAAMLGFFAWGLLRRIGTGRESLVLLEYVWVAFALVALFLWATGSLQARAFDAFVVGLAVFLAFGRLGCLTVGCCHGHRADWGVRYGNQHTHLSPRLRSGPLFPVQLVEGIALVLIFLVGLAAAAGEPGLATVWFLLSYAVVRFGTEALRGDTRPHLAGVSVPRLMAVLQFVAGLVVVEALLVEGTPGRATVVLAGLLLVASVAGFTLTRRRGRNPLQTPAHLDETWDRAVDLARSGDADAPETGTPDTDTTSQGMLIAASPVSDGLHVSLSHPRYDVTGVARALRPSWQHTSHSVTHLVLPIRVPARTDAVIGSESQPVAAGYFEATATSR